MYLLIINKVSNYRKSDILYICRKYKHINKSHYRSRFQSVCKHENGKEVNKVVCIAKQRPSDVNDYPDAYLSSPARKPTLLTLRKVSTRISLSIPRRRTRTDSFHLLLIFYFKNHYSTLPVSPRDGICRSGLTCADCAG